MAATWCGERAGVAISSPPHSRATHQAAESTLQEESGSRSQLQRLAKLCFNCAADILEATQEAAAPFSSLMLIQRLLLPVRSGATASAV